MERDRNVMTAILYALEQAKTASLSVEEISKSVASRDYSTANIPYQLTLLLDRQSIATVGTHFRITDQGHNDLEA